MSTPAAPPPPASAAPDPFRAPIVEKRSLLTGTAPDRRAAATPRVLLAALAAGVATAWTMGDGLGANLLICALVGAVAASLAAWSAGRRLRPWTVVWSVLALVLLVVPVIYEAGWPTLLSVAAAVALTSLALHGGRRWTSMLLPLPAVLWQLGPSVVWAREGLKGGNYPATGKVLPVIKAVAVAVLLLAVFGSLFASADAAVADIMESLTPSFDGGDLPRRALLLALGTVTALGFAHMAAGPRRFDRAVTKPGPERGRLEWALPLAALNLMFAGFAVVQLVVLVGGPEAIMKNTGMSRSEYARQGFWQLTVVTVLTLIVVAVAKRWAPRTTPADRRLAKTLLGSLCVLSLVVVGSALRRMQFYVDASGLTQLRLWVLVVEIWLGVVFLLLIAAGALGRASWLPRVVMLSGALTAAVYGLMGPDAMIAEQNVARFEQTGQIDLRNVRDLSTDAVPALDRLPEDQRTCAVELIWYSVGGEPAPWYGRSISQDRAWEILKSRPPGQRPGEACRRAGLHDYYSGGY
ncbi:DUF4153 domain-containing protein [Kitasatospora sp. NPDC050543]|uniref:DUF4153 domain-containing protein n=1 Tax=Kitasatospora sp. NPDC050543 TaxID=3364054 RepID=UPI00378F920C